MQHLIKIITAFLLTLSLTACLSTGARQDDDAATSTPPTATAEAETPPAVVEELPPGPLKPFSWLEGCWKGSVNQRDYREHWLPLRGNMLLGASHTVVNGETQDYQFLRMEVDGEEVHYIISIPEQKEFRFKLDSQTLDDKDTVFTFKNIADTFPQTIIYRHATGGWMYIHVEGTYEGKPHQVIYPIRRIDCGTGEFLSE